MCDLNSQEIKSFETAGAAMNTIGSFTNTLVARRSAKFAAQLAEARAHDAKSRGESAAAKRLGKGARQRSSIRAQTAARGFDVNEGTAVRLQDDASLLAKIDANTIRENAEKEAFGHRSEAEQYRHRARTLDPFLSASGTLIGEVGRISGQRASRKAAGVD